MKTSIATVSLSGDLPEKLSAIARAGFDGVEIFENDFLAFDLSAREAGRLVREEGLEITLFQPFRDFEGLPRAPAPARLRPRRAQVRHMQELGADLLLVCSNVSPHALGGIDRAADDLAALGARAARRGLRIGYEASPGAASSTITATLGDRPPRRPSRRRPHPRQLPHPRPRHRHRLDPRHPRRPPLPRPARRRPQARPRPALLEPPLPHHARTGRPPRRRLPRCRPRHRLRRRPLPRDLQRPVPRRLRPRRRRRRQALLLTLADRIGLADITANAESAALPLPPRSAVERVEFVEFALDEAAAAEFRRLIASLGFRRTGRHRSKEVEVWTQGAIASSSICRARGLRPFLLHHPRPRRVRLVPQGARCRGGRAPRPRPPPRRSARPSPPARSKCPPCAASAAA